MDPGLLRKTANDSPSKNGRKLRNFIRDCGIDGWSEHCMIAG